jgi:hypothetical protein
MRPTHSDKIYRQQHGRVKQSDPECLLWNFDLIEVIIGKADKECAERFSKGFGYISDLFAKS